MPTIDEILVSRRVMDIVASLKQPDRDIFILKYAYSYTAQEIGGMFGRTEKAVERLNARTMKKVRGKIAQTFACVYEWEK